MSLPGWAKWVMVWLLGIATVAATAAGLGLFVVYSGAFDASASTPHRAVVAWATHTTMIHSVRARAKDIHAPRSFSPEAVQAGLVSYDAHCVACHGGPGVSRAPFASAMTPTAPYLLDAARRWSPAELFYIVHRGVKMTAMPAWGEVLSDRETWDLVAFLEALPRLSSADYARLRGRDAADQAFLRGRPGNAADAQAAGASMSAPGSRPSARIISPRAGPGLGG